MMKRYHASPVTLEVGSVILPGNFGRLIRLQQGAGDSLLHREYIYESVRKQDFPEKPSRLEATFACPGVDSMIDFMSTYRQRSLGELIYEVEIVDKESPTHSAPIHLVGVMPPSSTWDGYAKAPLEYWPWDATHYVVPMEVVTTSPLRILSRGLPLNEFELVAQVPR